LEQLEARTLLAYSPAQIAHAYGFDQISYSSGLRGAGQTIAIVDAFDDPTIQSDLHNFDVTFGLPDPVFTKFTPQGTPTVDAGWALEIALDVEWAHAIAPGAAINLVESLDNSSTNLYAADVYAAGLTGVSVVSNSWSGSEYSSEVGDDKYFVTPTGHQGVTFVFSAGDSGAPAEYPSASPNVLSVGGTTLNLSSNGTWLSETGWGFGRASRFFGGSGGGPSQFEAKPAFQNGIVSGTHRGTPDVAFDGDPNTGVYVYDTNNGGWFQVGGTSVGAPSWAGLIATVNQGRAINLNGSLKGSDLLSQIYKVSANDFHDITSGSNGYRAGPGFDFVTGRGSPKANLLIPDLVATVASPSASTTTTTKSVATPTVRTRKVLLDPTLVNTTTTPALDLARNIQAFFIQPTGLQGTMVQSTPLTAAPSVSVAGSLSQTLINRTSVFLSGGGSDRLADTLADEEPLEVMPAGSEQEKAAPVSPSVPTDAPSDESSSVKPMTDKAVDGFFMEPAPVVEPAEAPAGSVAPTQEEAAPAMELQSSMLGLVALVGSFWAVRTAREEEKRPALRR
jgi:hypothetical protein